MPDLCICCPYPLISIVQYPHASVCQKYIRKMTVIIALRLALRPCNFLLKVQAERWQKANRACMDLASNLCSEARAISPRLAAFPFHAARLFPSSFWRQPPKRDITSYSFRSHRPAHSVPSSAPSVPPKHLPASLSA